LAGRRGHSRSYIGRTLDVGRAAIRRAWKRGELTAAPFIAYVETEQDRRQRDPKGHPLTIPEMARQRLQAAATAFLKLPEGRAIGAGGELSIPAQELGEEWGLKETVDHPGRDTVGASRARLGLLVDTDTVDLGIDAAATIESRNSIEKILAHQKAAAHPISMKFQRRSEQELRRQNDP
jgi:hypothetical protein